MRLTVWMCSRVTSPVSIEMSSRSSNQPTICTTPSESTIPVSNRSVSSSLHRSDGFATRYSGNAEFTTAEAAFPVGYELVELAEAHGPYDAGLHWAEPDLDEAAAHMRTVVADPEARDRVGGAGRRLIQTSYSAEAIGPTIHRRVAEIGQALGLDPSPRAGDG